MSNMDCVKQANKRFKGHIAALGSINETYSVKKEEPKTNTGFAMCSF